MWECALACPHLILTVRPLAPQANSVFWSILLSTLPLSAGLSQARDSESESNYTDNYDCAQYDPDLYSNGLIYLELWRYIF